MPLVKGPAQVQGGVVRAAPRARRWQAQRPAAAEREESTVPQKGCRTSSRLNVAAAGPQRGWCRVCQCLLRAARASRGAGVSSGDLLRTGTGCLLKQSWRFKLHCAGMQVPHAAHAGGEGATSARAQGGKGAPLVVSTPDYGSGAAAFAVCEISLCSWGAYEAPRARYGTAVTRTVPPEV